MLKDKFHERTHTKSINMTQLAVENYVPIKPFSTKTRSFARYISCYATRLFILSTPLILRERGLLLTML